ncbi:MAG TPA: GNAT family N-acetyltransferase [Bryobacteraceae bacterium]|nr:GNAT family N-acetyltransferase [Bryobacteraceae bacterium]
MQIRVLTQSDISAAMRLKEAAGWNQTARDWAVFLDTEPEGCFGIDVDGTLAATAAVMCYGRDLAWIGMVLTAPEHRGRGLARCLMEHAISHAERRGAAVLKLDGTDMGVKLYRSLGFEDESAVERWERPPSPAPPAVDLRPGYHPDLDRLAFGADRATLLARLAEESAAVENGYAMGRTGSRAAYFGPCVATDPAAARRLLRWFLSRHSSERIFWDLLPGNREAACLAAEHGFTRLRSLVRMVRPGAAPIPHNDQYVFAIAGFEFG